MLLSQISPTLISHQMDPPPSAVASDPLPAIHSDSSKIRLMCSYGGHIIPRPQSKSLFYAGGDTRIIALDRRTTASYFSDLVTHLSRILFDNRPFHLKYQLPYEDLDSLVSVTTDEDLQNMIEEHDRASTVANPAPVRIRLFLFPIKPESLGSALLDRKSDLWFSDALNNTRIIQRGQSTDTGLQHETLGLDGVIRSDKWNVERNGRGGGGEVKEVGGGVPESLILETSSSFGSTSSSVSMANSPAIGVPSEESYVGLLEKKIRVPSSASIESENSVGSANVQLKKGTHQETLFQVASGGPACSNEIGNPIFDQISNDNTQKAAPLSGYYISPPFGGNHQPYELVYNQGGMSYMNQYTTGPLPPPSYYPMYHMPVHPQAQSPYMMNQPYPIYLVPVRPNQNLPNVAASQPPVVHHQNAFVSPPPAAYEEVNGSQLLHESASKTYPTVSSTTPSVVAPIIQVKQQNNIEPLDQGQLSETASVVSSVAANELDDDIAYTQIYKTQPSAPSLLPQYHTLTRGMNVLLSES